MTATVAGPELVRLDALLRRGEPGRPALTFRDETLTYRELRERVGRAATGLRRLGLRTGDRVAVHLEKRLETVIAIFAVSAAGGVVVPVNPVLKPAQVAYLLADCAARILITTPQRHRVLDTAPEHVVLVGEPGWAELCATDDGLESEAAGIAAILYTSGSTGRPKGVVLSHRNVLTGALSVAGYLGHTRADVILSLLPLSFDAGLSQLTTAFVAGAHVVLLNYVEPRAVVRLCARHGVTGLTCVPPLWQQLAAARWPDPVRLRYFANTGGHLSLPTLTRLRAHFPDALPYLMYGLTEAFRSTYLDPAEIDRRPDSIGKAIPDAEVLVVRPDGSVCGPGEQGEIVHRGPLVAEGGYWRDPERTAARFRPWPPGGAEIAVWSGDRGHTDEQGFLYFAGRTDELIKTSGYRVSPTEIEEAAYATGLVTEAVAFGVPDERLGQRVALVVGGPCDTGELAAALAEALPGYMLPGRITVLAGLPRTGNGKFDRTALRRLAAP